MGSYHHKFGGSYKVSQHQPPGRIHGLVIDAQGQPVPKASVRVHDDIVVIDLQTTNRRGEFTSRLLFSGRYTVEAEHEGRKGIVEDVEVRLDETTSVTVTLRK